MSRDYSITPGFQNFKTFWGRVPKFNVQPFLCSHANMTILSVPELNSNDVGWRNTRKYSQRKCKQWEFLPFLVSWTNSCCTLIYQSMISFRVSMRIQALEKVSCPRQIWLNVMKWRDKDGKWRKKKHMNIYFHMENKRCAMKNNTLKSTFGIKFSMVMCI